MSQLRRDPVLGRWVIISSERGHRPTDFEPAQPRELNGFCAFCPGNEEKTPPEIIALREPGTRPNTGGWRVRVVPNKFPALNIEGEVLKRGRGIYDIINGVGAHEVFIECPDHDKTISTISQENMRELIWAYRQRLIDLAYDERLKYVLIFRNAGMAAGASLSHPHSQLMATPIVPKRITEELSGTRAYLDFKDRCVFCDMVDEERDYGKRVIEENKYFISFTPFAARFPFEMWLLPKTHQECLRNLTDEQIPFLADCFQRSIRRLDAAVEYPPYNFLLHTSPCNTGKNHFYHWHFEIIPRLTHIAGFEWGSGFYVNPTPPEQAAEILRETQID